MVKKSLLLLSISALLLSSCSQGESKKYTLSLDANGGDVSVTSIKVAPNGTANLPIPTKNNKEFQGWFTGWAEEDYEVTSSTKIKSDLSLIAKWNTYDLSYYEKEDGNVFYTQEVKANELTSMPTVYPSKTDDEYFLEWDFSFDTRVNSDCKIYPLWTEEETIYVNVDFSGYFIHDKKYTFSSRYQESLFDSRASIYNRDLMDLSYVTALSCDKKEQVQQFFTDIGFDNIVISPDYYEPKVDGASYVFAHKKVRGNDVIAITSISLHYTKEWSSNFDLGNSGNHNGFYSSAKKVEAALDSYVANGNYNNAKYWITGYSRAGAIANCLASILESKTDSETFAKDYYVYTFATPRGLLKENAKEYQNVFNFVNSADLVSRFAPEQYGMYRCGVDIDYYKENVSDLVHAFDNEIALPDFVKSSSYKTDQELVDYLITNLTNTSYSDDVSLATRELYYNNYQDALMYVIAIVMSLKNSTIESITADIKSKIESDITALLPLITSGEGLFTYINPFIKADGVEYDEAILRGHCDKIVAFLQGPGIILLSLINSLQRMVAMHYPELIYVLIKQIKD